MIKSYLTQKENNAVFKIDKEFLYDGDSKQTNIFQKSL